MLISDLCCCFSQCCVSVCVFFVFCFKQKTAYELRISDWSSDVCSSDLNFDEPNPEIITLEDAAFAWAYTARWRGQTRWHGRRMFFGVEIGRASCRERVCQYV